MQNNISSSATGGPGGAARTAMGLAVVFLALLSLLHLLEPEFDPSWRMISEYALGRFGWMMSLAFFVWGGAVVALLAALWRSLRGVGGVIGRVWLIVIAVALFSAGIFKTNAITDTTPSTTNNLHALCGAIVILTFPIAATVIAVTLGGLPRWTVAARRLLWATVLVWVTQFAFFGSIILSNMMNPAAGRVGPEVTLGWPNRLNVAAIILWIVVVARHAVRAEREEVADGT